MCWENRHRKLHREINALDIDKVFEYYPQGGNMSKLCVYMNVSKRKVNVNNLEI